MTGDCGPAGLGRGFSIVTPTYAPDRELFRLLRLSIEMFLPQDVRHYVVIPASSRPEFAEFESSRVILIDEESIMPRRFKRLGSSGYWLTLARPVVPIRNWMFQQALKLQIVSKLDDDFVLLVDSDVEFVRPFSPASVMKNGSIGLFRRRDGVRSDMKRHLQWHKSGRELLRLPRTSPGAVPAFDYVSSLNVWDPRVVRDIATRIEREHLTPWLDCFVSRLHMSEFTLYGIYCDDVVGSGLQGEPIMPTLDFEKCHCYWNGPPLDLDQAVEFGSRVDSDAVAMMISSKSQTTVESRRAASAAVRSILGNGVDGRA